MKRAWMLILLVSLGLNVGLAIKVFTGSADGHDRFDRSRWRDSRVEDRHWPAPGDTATWRKLGMKRAERVKERLDLTSEQATSFSANQQRAMMDLGARRKVIDGVKNEIRDLMAAPEIDREAVQAAHSRLGALQAEFDSLVANYVLNDLEILTPGQREEYLRMHPFGAEGRRGPSRGGQRGPRHR